MADLMIPEKYWGIDRTKDTDTNRLIITSLVFTLAWGLLVLFLMNINRADKSQWILVVLSFAIILALTGVFLYNVYKLSTEVFQLKNDANAAWKRDNWLEHHLIPFIEETENVFVGQCLDKRALVFSAVNTNHEKVEIRVGGMEEHEFSSSDPALYGYEMTRGLTFTTSPLPPRKDAVQVAIMDKQD